MNDLDEESFQALYGRWSPMEPAAMARLLEGSGVQWWIAGGRAARIGAPARPHEDTDVVVSLADLPALRRHLRDWHLWEAHEGSLRPLLPSDELRPDREQLWLRRDAEHPWEADLMLHRGEDEWVFKKDTSVRLPWERALHTVDGVIYLRPELALLHKAHLDRPKDRADLGCGGTRPAGPGLARRQLGPAGLPCMGPCGSRPRGLVGGQGRPEWCAQPAKTVALTP